MELKEGSETSAFKIQTPGKYPKEYLPHLQHGESLKTKKPHDDSLRPENCSISKTKRCCTKIVVVFENVHNVLMIIKTARCRAL
jgi:hypothetical protein